MKHFVDIPEFLSIFDEIKEMRKKTRISRDYLHRMTNAIKKDLTPVEIVIIRARIDGIPFSHIAKEVAGITKKEYSRQRIAQMENEILEKISKIQDKENYQIFIRNTTAWKKKMETATFLDDLEPTDEELQAIERELEQ